MTASLPARAAALRKQLVELNEMSSSVTEAGNLEGLRLEISTRAQRLGAQLDKQALLADAKIAVPSPTSVIAVRKRASELLEKFVADTKAATLKKRKGWTTLLGDIDTAGRELESAISSTWRAHRQAVFAGDTPTAIRGRLARTKENDEAFKTYQALYTRFKAAFDEVPADKYEVDQVRSLAGQLEQAAQAFDFDVPAEVKEFLEAVLSVNGAPISLLTPTVRQWLEANGALESYTIRSTGRG